MYLSCLPPGLSPVELGRQILVDEPCVVVSQLGHLGLGVRPRFLGVEVVHVEQLDPALTCAIVVALERRIGPLLAP